MVRFVSAVVIALLATDIAWADEANGDLEKIQGDWSLDSLQVDGESGPRDAKYVNKVTIKGDRMTIVLKSPDSKKEEQKSKKIKLDSTKNRKAIELIDEEGRFNEMPVPGIHPQPTICLPLDRYLSTSRVRPWCERSSVRSQPSTLPIMT
jgi:uncharacterized protein (TIGR03067 family)